MTEIGKKQVTDKTMTAADKRKITAFRRRYPDEKLVVYRRAGLERLGIDLRDWILAKKVAKVKAV